MGDDEGAHDGDGIAADDEDDDDGKIKVMMLTW